MKKKVAVFLILTVIMTMSLPQMAWADSEDEDNTYQYESGILPYSAQMEDETSIRLTWLGYMSVKGVIISWKEAGSSQEEQSVRIDHPQTKTYVVKNLQPGKKYDFHMTGILTGADGRELLTERWPITGATYLQTPELMNYESMGDYITTKWKLAEKYSALKLYRAESKNGSYKQIATVGNPEAGDRYKVNIVNEYFPSSGETPCREDQHMIAIYKDTDVKPGKTYYYKAQAAGTTSGKLYTSEESKIEPLCAKNTVGLFEPKVLNKAHTYTKQIRLKLTSDKGNYKTYLKKLKSLYSLKSWSNKMTKRAVTKVEYSLNGKKFYPLKNKNVAIEGGKSIYLRISTKTKFWIRKDGKIRMHFDVKYCRPPEGGSADGVELEFYCPYYEHDPRGVDTRDKGWIRGRLRANDYNRDLWNDPLSKFDQRIDDRLYLFHGVNLYPEAAKVSDNSVLLQWGSVGYRAPVAGYALRYGTTKESVMPSKEKAVLLPNYQVEYLFDGLEKGKTYYFSVIPFAEAGGGSEYEASYYIIEWDGETFTRL